MRRPAFIAALLLPLPFAALPLFSLLFTPAAETNPAPTVAVTVQPAEAVDADSSLAMGVEGGQVHHHECHPSTPTIEG